jgi:hypothetical protein
MLMMIDATHIKSQDEEARVYSEECAVDEIWEASDCLLYGVLVARWALVTIVVRGFEYGRRRRRRRRVHISVLKTRRANA